MKHQTFVLSLVLVLLFTQCKRSIEPCGYYCVINEYYKPAHIFYYNNNLHYSHYFFNREITKEWSDSIMSVFREKEKVFAFYDGNAVVDTLRFTNLYQSTNVLQYHFVYTPSVCKFYVYYPDWLVGTYEFFPNNIEQGLISFAVSQLDFGDTMPEFNSFKRQPNNVIIEDAFFSLQIKSDRLNVDLVANLYADEVSDAVFFLSDVLDALVYDYCNPENQTKEEPENNVLESFEEKISKKYIPPIPFPED